MNLTIVKGFTEKVCIKCGVLFLIPNELERNLLQTGQTWCCPNGHPQNYAESEADKYKRLYEDSESYRKNSVKRNEMLQADVKALQNALDRCKKPRAKRVAKK